MSNQKESTVWDRPEPRMNIFMRKPQHVKRHMMIADRFRDVIDDHIILEHSKDKGKFVKCDLLPPLTASYRLNRHMREITKVEALLNKEIAKCGMDDVERKELLKQVIAKCDAMKTEFSDSERAYLQLQKDLACHKQMLDAEVTDKKRHKMALKRYLVAGESLMKIWEIMDKVIAENQCYYDFVQEVSIGSNMQAIANFIERFETHISTRSTLSQHLNEAIERSETKKTQLRKKKNDWEHDLVFEVEKLQNIHFQTMSTNIMNSKYEDALNNINTCSVEHQMEINGVLKSAEQIIENLIQNKVLGKSYRKKTLAQQFEAIREDYKKRKAIIHEHEKAKLKVEQKKSRRMALYDTYSKGTLASRAEDIRLNELFEKKRMLMAKRKYSDYLKMKKRSLVVESSEKEFEPLANKRNFVKLEGSTKRSLSVESDDMDGSDGESDELELIKYEDNDLSFVEMDYEDLQKSSFLDLSDLEGLRLSTSSSVSRKIPTSSLAGSQSIVKNMKFGKQSWL